MTFQMLAVQHSTSKEIHTWQRDRPSRHRRPDNSCTKLRGMTRAATITSETAMEATRLCGTRWKLRTRRMVARTSPFQMNVATTSMPNRVRTNTLKTERWAWPPSGPAEDPLLLPLSGVVSARQLRLSGRSMPGLRGAGLLRAAAGAAAAGGAALAGSGEKRRPTAGAGGPRPPRASPGVGAPGWRPPEASSPVGRALHQPRLTAAPGPPRRREAVAPRARGMRGWSGAARSGRSGAALAAAERLERGGGAAAPAEEPRRGLAGPGRAGESPPCAVRGGQPRRERPRRERCCLVMSVRRSEPAPGRGGGQSRRPLPQPAVLARYVPPLPGPSPYPSPLSLPCLLPIPCPPAPRRPRRAGISPGFVSGWLRPLGAYSVPAAES